MGFASIGDAKIHYTRYARNKGFRFCMSHVTKSRTNGMTIGQEFLCSNFKGWISYDKKLETRE
jgi:hypothetical protein